MKILELVQGTHAWKAERAKYNTASEAPVMMGVSKKATRSDLLRIKSTGIEKEFSAWVEKNLFANGHEVEAKARPIAEEIIGEELYPAVAVSDDDTLLASFDGITMLESVIWECKQRNAEKAKTVETGKCPDEDYWQVVQQLAVSGAEKCLCMVTDGTEENTVYCWVTCTEEDIQSLRDGWAQFNKDRATYEPPAAEKIVTGSAPSALPALRIELSGAVAESNLDEFRDQAIAVFESINIDLQTDEQFADAESTVKWCAQVEKKLSAAKDHALSQTADIDRLFKTIDEISEQARKKRLELDKLVKSMKEQRKDEILRTAEHDYDAHIGNIEKDLERGNLWPIRFPAPSPMTAQAMKGKRTLATLRDAAETAVANAKIEADRIARGIRANLDVLKTEAEGFETLFPDGGQLAASKTEDDLRNTIKTRIAEHEQRESVRNQNQSKNTASSLSSQYTVKTNAAGVVAGLATPELQRPSDDQIIKCVADAFGVDRNTARDWIARMDIIDAEA